MEITVKDSNGKTRYLRVDYFKGTAIVASEVDTLEPVASVIVQDSGEMCAALRSPELRSNDDLSFKAMEAMRSAIKAGILPCNSGYMFSFMQPDHGSNKDMPKIGAELTVVEFEGKKLNRWAVPIERVLSGALK
jgi:hypothetical protein